MEGRGRDENSASAGLAQVCDSCEDSPALHKALGKDKGCVFQKPESDLIPPG